MPLAIEHQVDLSLYDDASDAVYWTRNDGVTSRPVISERYIDHNNSKDLATATALMRALIKVKS